MTLRDANFLQLYKTNIIIEHWCMKHNPAEQHIKLVGMRQSVKKLVSYHKRTKQDKNIIVSLFLLYKYNYNLLFDSKTSVL